MKKFQKTMNEWCSVNKRLRVDCTKYLKGALKRSGTPLVIDCEDEFITVAYNGGRHPEYNSNVYSQVNSVYLKDGEIFLEIEDCDEYPIADVEAFELFDICRYIEQYIEGR